MSSAIYLHHRTNKSNWSMVWPAYTYKKSRQEQLIISICVHDRFTIRVRGIIHKSSNISSQPRNLQFQALWTLRQVLINHILSPTAFIPRFHFHCVLSHWSTQRVVISWEFRGNYYKKKYPFSCRVLMLIQRSSSFYLALPWIGMFSIESFSTAL